MKVKTKGIRVWVVLEYDYVDSPDSSLADEITQSITSSTEWLADELDASRCYVQDVTDTLWVET